MKKLMLIIALFLLTACGNDDKKSESSDSINVDKNLTNVEITIPASLVNEQSMDEIQEEAKENGITDVVQNDDGSITYKMSKKAHKKMMKEMEEELIDTLDDLKNDDDYPSIKDVKYNKSYDDFTLVVNKEKYENSMDALATFAIGFTSMFYHLFNGEDPEKTNIKISIEDEATGEVLDTVQYPKDMENK